MNRPARRVLALVLAGLCLLALVACKDKPKEPAKGGAQAPRRAAPVTVAQAAQRSVPIVLAAIGNVEASESVAIKSQMTATLMGVHFREGQDVVKGQLLFSLDTRAEEAAIREGRARLESYRAQLVKAEEDNRRYTRLLADKTISQDAFDQVATNLAVLRANIKASEASLEAARVRQSYARIVAPIAGRTGVIRSTVGNMIKANADEAMVVIQKIEPVDVSFSLPEGTLAQLLARMAEGKLPVEARASGSEQPAEQGELTFVDNAVDTKTGTIRLKASFHNRQRRLWPGQFVDVALRLRILDNAVVVPSAAVQTGGEGLYVYVVKADNSAEFRKVTTGATVGDVVVVQKGVAAGEVVVTDGQLRLTPGAAVEVRGPAEAKPAKEAQGQEPQANATAGQPATGGKAQ